ncbi:ABC transporter ATP-binding protein [Bacillus massiliigorillae]|uniref:ABC transporter ATP-binding protein n=1 Tax=Bacillus massiliigorillae TaxID=1243664 RepID=UPI0003A38CE3|nr:ABC transporter ATP-binding protein [Bacillus massiliigorillae]
MVDGKKHDVLHDVNAFLPQNSISVILGKSGCGKTTFLRILANLEQYDQGEVSINNDEKIGFVFQEPRLMPWLSVSKNITFGLEKQMINLNKLEELMNLIGLKKFEKAYPHQLSGGMQQRVALARALAYDPSIILMDEPFAALDYFTRETMQKELIRIYQLKKKSIIFVTHSIEEAIAIGQNILVFNEGKVHAQFNLEQYEYPRDVLSPSLIEIKKEILKKLA